MTEVSNNIRVENPMVGATSIRKELTGGRKDIEGRMKGRIVGMQAKIGRIDTVLNAYSKGEQHRMSVSNARHTPYEYNTQGLETYKFKANLKERIKSLEQEEPKGWKERVEFMQEQIRGFDAGYSEFERYRELISRGYSVESADRERPFRNKKVGERQGLIEEFKRELKVVTAAKKAFLGLGAVAVRSGLLKYKDESYYDLGFKYGRMRFNRVAAAAYGTAVAGVVLAAYSAYGMIQGGEPTTSAGGESIPTPPPVVEQTDKSIPDRFAGLVDLPPTPEPASAPTATPEPPPTVEPTPVTPTAEVKTPQPPTPTATPEPTSVPKPDPEVKKTEPKVPEFKNNFSNPGFEEDINILLLPLTPLRQEEIEKFSDTLDSMETSGKEEGYYFANIGEQNGPKRAMILTGEYKKGDTRIFYIISPYYGSIALVLTSEEGDYMKNRIHDAVQKGNSAASTPSIQDIKLVDLRDNTIGGELTPGAKTDRMMHLQVGQGDQQRDVWRGATQASAAEINNAVARSARLSETWRLQDTPVPR